MIQCDGKLPACTQCLLTGRRCAGYQQGLTIIQHKPAAAGFPRGISTKASQRTLHVRQPSYQDPVAVIVQNYVPRNEISCLSSTWNNPGSRFCGAWVGTLPQLSQRSVYQDILSRAMRALCLCLMTKTVRSNSEYIKTYCGVLHGMRDALYDKTGPFDPVIVVAGMCMTLSEVGLPTKTFFRYLISIIRSHS